jgi:hypothetical protein
VCVCIPFLFLSLAVVSLRVSQKKSQMFDRLPLENQKNSADLRVKKTVVKQNELTEDRIFDRTFNKSKRRKIEWELGTWSKAQQLESKREPSKPLIDWFQTRASSSSRERIKDWVARKRREEWRRTGGTRPTFKAAHESSSSLLIPFFLPLDIYIYIYREREREGLYTARKPGEHVRYFTPTSSECSEEYSVREYSIV